MDKFWCTSCQRDKAKEGLEKGPSGRLICASCVERIAKHNSKLHQTMLKKQSAKLKSNPDGYADSILKRCRTGDE
jgi:hypothetical protein